jgi:glycosyltransferase involved in cell wall biosynthesis
MRFSVVTATFNRRTLLPRALNSALEFVRIVGDGEVVVIDDASHDGTVDMIRTVYAAQIEAGLLKLVGRRQASKRRLVGNSRFRRRITARRGRPNPRFYQFT